MGPTPPINPSAIDLGMSHAVSVGRSHAKFAPDIEKGAQFSKSPIWGRNLDCQFEFHSWNRASFRSAAVVAKLPLTDDTPAEMSGQKRKRLTPGLSGFTKVGTSDVSGPARSPHDPIENVAQGLNPPGVDPLSMSFAGAGAGFSCETPTMAPVSTPATGPPATAKMFRFSPRLSASSGIFNSPMFSVQTPVFEYQSAPNVFHNSLLSHGGAGSGAVAPHFGATSAMGGGAPQQSQQHSGLMSPIPFMESPTTMYSHDLQQHSLTMDNPPGLSLAGTQPQNSVLERFKKFFDNQRMPADFGSPSMSVGGSSINDSFSLGMPFQSRDSPSNKPPIPLSDNQQSVPTPAADDDEISSGDSHELLSPGTNPELAESLLRSGSSCHQCKSRRMQGYLSFCSGAKSKRKSCRKKYCDACLAKFYQMAPSRNRSAREQTVWSCPSCQGICCCAACRRSKIQQNQASRMQMQQQYAKTPELYSPATSMAVGLVYFGDFDLLDGSIPIQLPPPAMSSRQPEPLAFASLQ